jgi:alpha-tubulin suppressor-like RCC1 family protein
MEDRNNILNQKRITSLCSAYHTLILSDGKVFSVGYNQNGQLGDSTSITRLSPVAIVDANNVLTGKTPVAVSCNVYHSMILSSDGKVFTFGSSTGGVLVCYNR